MYAMYAQGEMRYACKWKHAMDVANAMHCYGKLCNDAIHLPYCPSFKILSLCIQMFLYIHHLDTFWLHLTTIKALKSNKATYGCIVKAKDLNSIIPLVTLKVIHLVLQASDARDQELRSPLSAARSCPKQGLHQHAAARSASAVDLFEIWLWNSGKTSGIYMICVVSICSLNHHPLLHALELARHWELDSPSCA